jgi:hypothetical protein
METIHDGLFLAPGGETGDLKWTELTWLHHPTKHHITSSFAALPIKMTQAVFTGKQGLPRSMREQGFGYR